MERGGSPGSASADAAEAATDAAEAAAPAAGPAAPSRPRATARPRHRAAIGRLPAPLCALALLAASWAVNPALHAQTHSMRDLVEGDSVRIRMRGALRVAASIADLRGDTLVLRVQGLNDPWRVSQVDLLTLEQHTGRNAKEGFRHGATLGLAGGFFVGAVAGAVVALAGDVDDDVDRSTAVMGRSLRWGGIAGALGGLGGGFFGGAHPGRGWVMLELPYR